MLLHASAVGEGTRGILIGNHRGSTKLRDENERAKRLECHAAASDDGDG